MTDQPPSRDEILTTLRPGPMLLNDLAAVVARRVRTGEDHVVAEFWSLVEEGEADYSASGHASLTRGRRVASRSTTTT